MFDRYVIVQIEFCFQLLKGAVNRFRPGAVNLKGCRLFGLIFDLNSVESMPSYPGWPTWLGAILSYMEPRPTKWLSIPVSNIERVGEQVGAT